MRRWSVPTALAALLLAAAPAAARGGMPAPITERGAVIEGIYFQIFVAGVVVTVIVFALLGFILWRYREGSGKGRATYEKERDNIKAEATWTLIPLIIVLWVGVISYAALVELDHMDSTPFEPDLVIDITGAQWAWMAEYPSGLRVTANANPDLTRIDPFYVPADTSLLFRITAADVIHSFNVVALKQTIDATPGRVSELPVQAGLPPGEYFTQCKEICLTPGHSYMHARIIAVPQAQYEEWHERMLAGAAAGLTQGVPLQFDGATLEALDGDQLALGATATIQFGNDHTAPATFRFNDTEYEVAAGSIASITFNVTQEGDFPVEVVDGPTLVLRAVAPEVIRVELGDLFIRPASLEVQAGRIYVIEIENVGRAPHDLYIGTSGADGKRENGIRWHSANNVPGGESDAFLVTPREAATLEMWCSVSGHYSQMNGAFVVT